MPLCVQYGVSKNINVFCAKPKKINPIKLNFCMTNKCFESTQISDYQWSSKILDKGIDHRKPLLSEISLLCITFYWRNDTHNLCNLTVFIPKSVHP